MQTFSLHLQSTEQNERLDDIASFVGGDASGKFGILANHARMMTCLNFGLCQFKNRNEMIEYLALPGGVLYFNKNILTINTQYYLRDTDYNKLENALNQLIQKKESSIKNINEALNHIDETILKRIWELNRKTKYEQ